MGGYPGGGMCIMCGGRDGGGGAWLLLASLLADEVMLLLVGAPSEGGCPPAAQLRYSDGEAVGGGAAKDGEDASVMVKVTGKRYSIRARRRNQSRNHCQ